MYRHLQLGRPGAVLLILFFAGQAAPGTTSTEVGGCGTGPPERVVDADPGTYLGLLATLGPGDLLQLGAGTYASGLPLDGLNGEAGRCIVIEGPAQGPAAIFPGRDCCNTVQLGDTSYLVVRQLELDGQGRAGDGVKSSFDPGGTHHITLEDLYIHGHGADQQIVGISTKGIAWNWVIRRNVIEGAGTGIYLGDSDGSAEFVAGLIEYNLIVDTRGYNMQIKHQNGRATGLGIPSSARTVIRHNVFSKANNAAAGGDARPNLLLGHWPLAGAGSDDDYLVYGNLFHQNPTGEPLVQAEGHVIFYANLLLNDVGLGLSIQPHNDVPRRIRVFQNTVVATGTGINVVGGHGSFEQRVVGNAAFAAPPLNGGFQGGNTTDAYAAAASYLTNPDGVMTGASDRLDLFPLPGALNGASLDLSGLSAYEDWNRDFNGGSRPGTFRGAYASDGSNPGWLPALELKPELGPVFSDGFESGDSNRWSQAVP